MLKFPLAALAHLGGELLLEVAEVGKGLRRIPFLAHEQHGRRGRQQQHSGGGPQRRFILHDVAEPLAERAVADLIVVLQEDDKGGGRQVGARLAARPSSRTPNARPGKQSLPPDCDTASHGDARHSPRSNRPFRRSGSCAGSDARHRPTAHRICCCARVRRGSAPGSRRFPTRDRCCGRRRHRRARPRNFRHDVLAAVVDDGVNRIESQPVEVEFLEPVQRVVDVEVAHRAVLAIEVDGGAPGRVVPLGEKLRRVHARGNFPRGRNGCRRHRASQRCRARGPHRPALSNRSACRRQLSGANSSTPSYPQPRLPGKSATGINSMTVTPSSTR